MVSQSVRILKVLQSESGLRWWSRAKTVNHSAETGTVKAKKRATERHKVVSGKIFK